MSLKSSIERLKVYSFGDRSDVSTLVFHTWLLNFPHSFVCSRGLKFILKWRESICSSMVITWLVVPRNVESKALCMSLADCMLITPFLVLVLIANDLMRVIIWVNLDSEGSSSSLVDSSSLLVSLMIN